MRATKSKLKTFDCEICKKRFSRKRIFQRHKLKHSKNKHFSCSKCNKRFRSKDALKVHLDAHPKQTTIECKVCKKGFTANCDALRHVKWHTNGKLCDKCNVRNIIFSAAYELMLQLTHKASAKCLQHFIAVRDLRKRSKKSERAFKCEKCGRRFLEQTLLSDHTRKCMEEKCFSCGLCDVVFKRKKDCRKHLEEEHSAKCKPEFVNERDLQPDMLTYACFKRKRVCKEVFRTRRDLLKHWSDKHDENVSKSRSISCICGMRFKRSQDLLVHEIKCRCDKIIE